MKKLFMAAILAVTSIAANAQLWAGGQAGFSTGEVRGIKYTSFNILPEIGYSLNENWDIAMLIGDEYTKVKHADALNAFVVNPYVRYTFAKVGKVGFFIDGGFKIKTGDFYDSTFDKSYVDETAWGIGIQPGVKFAATDKLTLVAKLGNLGYTSVDDDHAFGFDANGNALSFGAYFAF